MSVYFSRDLDRIDYMETFHQELAIKVFDHFFLEKHKVKGFVIFSREVDRWFTDDSRNTFGIDVIIDDNKSDLPNNRFTDYNGYSLFEIFDDNTALVLPRAVSNFHLIEQDPDQAKFIIQNHLKQFSPNEFPDFIKAIIVKSSLYGRTLTGVKFLGYNGIIPKTKSLEELAIQMELES